MQTRYNELEPFNHRNIENLILDYYDIAYYMASKPDTEFLLDKMIQTIGLLMDYINYDIEIGDDDRIEIMDYATTLYYTCIEIVPNLSDDESRIDWVDNFRKELTDIYDVNIELNASVS